MVAKFKQNDFAVNHFISNQPIAGVSAYVHGTFASKQLMVFESMQSRLVVTFQGVRCLIDQFDLVVLFLVLLKRPLELSRGLNFHDNLLLMT